MNRVVEIHEPCPICGKREPPPDLTFAYQLHHKACVQRQYKPNIVDMATTVSRSTNLAKARRRKT